MAAPSAARARPNAQAEDAPLLAEDGVYRSHDTAAFAVPPVPSPEQFDSQLQLRRVDFSMMAYFSSSWEFFWPNVWRFLGIELLVMLLFFLIGGVGAIFNGLVLSGIDENVDPWNLRAVIYHLIFDFLPGPLLLDPIHASAFVAVFRAMRTNKLIELRDFFATFESPYYLSLLGLIFLRMLLSTALLMLFVLPGIWFLICVVFAFPLHFEHRHLGAWGAIKGSITVVMHYFCEMFFFLLLLLLLQVAGLMFFGVGFLLTLPFALVAVCYCYHHLIGINGMPVLHVHRAAAAPPTVSSASQTTAPHYGATNV